VTAFGGANNECALAEIKSFIPNSTKSRRQRRQKSSARSRRSRGSRRGAPLRDSGSVVSPLTVGSFIRGREIKVHFVNPPTSITTAGWTVDLCNGIAQGTNWTDQRIGNRIHVVHFAIDAVLSGGQANVITDDNRNTIRMALVRASPGVSWSGFTLNSVLDPRLISGLAHVYFDRVFTIQSPGRDTVGYMPAVRIIREKIRVAFNTVFTGTGTATQSFQTLWLLFVSDSAAPPSPGFVSGGLNLQYLDD